MARIKYYNKQTGQWEYADNVLMPGSASAVEYIEQVLTEEQKEQARKNIGAIAAIAEDDINMDGFRITNLPLPTTGSEPATKEFVENFTVEGSTYVATDDNKDGNIVLRPYAADADELEFRGHIKNKENPHGVTLAQIGAAPAGFGLGGDSTLTVTTLADLDLVTANGTYQFTNSSATLYEINCRWAILRVTNYDSAAVMQELFPTGSTIRLVRYRNANVWGEWEVDNPPMAPGVEYRTTERINGKAIYKKNVDGAIQYRLDGEDEWKKQHGLMGSAPSGYGLGGYPSEYIGSVAELDTRFKYGLYMFGAQTTNICNVLFQYATLLVYPFNNDICVQELRPVMASPDQMNVVFRRYCYGGSFSEWEIENPPMALGVEYRTTERCGGKVVYAKAISLGTLTSNEMSVSVGAGTIYTVRATGRMVLPSGSIRSLPCVDATYGAICVQTNHQKVWVRGQNDITGSGAEVVVWYTKEAWE